MEKRTLKIEDYEDKKAKTGTRYTRFKTEDGWMSCFEADVIKPLKELEGKRAIVEVAVDDEKGFKNIRAFHGEAEDPNETPEIKVEKPGKAKEFHLTDEAVRIGALEAAIKVTKKTGTEDYKGDLFKAFKQFEHWISTGKRQEE
jgi:hypothetical protein